MQVLAANYYEMLGVGQKATLDEIKAAYARQLAAFRDMLVQRKPCCRRGTRRIASGLQGSE